ncbi:hypothetical protein AAZX31_17G034100 [Glycine max]|uniref:Uncharacterized protein n=2 Tax=Glycine subgen. Soja TaxID=1462606 RepID=K7MJS1_SOYBN|nr:hypothetical protein GYH30_046132 [Glycine max]KRH02377.1 hypothetical protein GLYMA_17G035100v4 [Glycine max]RZB55006.1 hypothetical protein D0Y65_044772 [Glycine soja]
MKESQTPHKTHALARSSEKSNRRSQDSPNFNKIQTKCLNAALKSISEVPMNSSTISDTLYANRSEDATISLVEEGLKETLLPSDKIPSEKVIDEVGIVSIKCLYAYELESSMFPSTESEIAAIDLTNAKPKVFNSHNAAPQYKNLMDEITKYIIEDLYTNTVPEDFDRSYQLMSAKNRTVLLLFCTWLIGVLAIFFFTSDIHCPYRGPLPT